MDPSSNPIFITSKEASSLTGYVSDYITRQCRAGKIKSKQEGRVWVIEKESLLQYFAGEEKRKEANAQALARSREEEYREAQKARKAVEPVPSPYIPASVPFEWKEEEYRAPIRGSFAALAMTLVVLSAGMYLSLKETQTGVLSMIQTIGDETVTFVGSGVYQTLGIKDGEHRVLAGGRYALPEVTLKESRVEEVFARIEKTLLGSKEVPRVALRNSESLEKNFEVPHLLPPVIENGGVMLGASLRQVSDSVLGIYMDGVDRWVRVTPEIPPRIISFVGNVGYTLASLSNSAPTRVATSVGGFENFALGVVGHVALAYDTTKETLVTAYHYAPGAKLAAVREATSQVNVVASEREKEEAHFAKESEVKFETVVREGLARLSGARGEVVASAGASGGFSFFESLARGTYEAINGLFGGIGRSVAGVFVREHATVEEIREEVVLAETPNPSKDKESVVLAPQTSLRSTATINQYYTVTTTGVSKEYVEERIRLHLDNLDDRVDERIDSVNTGGGGGGSGSVTSLDVSGGTTGFSFAGGPITSSGTLTMSGTLAVANGGTGMTTAPTYGQLLLGNSLGGYTLVATSSLGISGGSGTPGGADGEVQFNQGGTFGAESAFSYASTTNTLLVTSGVIQSTSGIFRGDDQYHQIILHNGGNNSDYIEWGDTLAAGGGHRFYTGGATPTLRMQIADDGTYLEGPVGIGTTSPGTRLSVQGNQYTSGSAFFGGAFTATSTVALTNYTNGALAVSGSGALYAFSTSSWSFASSTLLSDTNIWSGVNNFINRLSNGSSSPFAKFSIHANNGENYTNNTLFAIGSSTASATTTLFSVSNTGRTTIGNAAGSAVSLNLVANTGNTVALNLTNGNTGGLSYNASGNNLQLYGPAGTALAVTGNAGDIALTGRTGSGSAGGTLALTAGASNGTDFAGANVTVSAGAATGNAAGGSILFNTSIVGSTGSTVQALTERLRITNTGNIGIASTSPWAQLSVNPNGITGPAFAVGSSTATRFVITNGGTVAIGGPTSSDFVTEFGTRTFANYTDSTYTNGYAFVLGRGQDGTDNSAPNFYFTRNNGSGSTIANGNYIGRLSALPWDGDEGVFSSAINFRVNGTVADNSIPTDITFETGSQNSNIGERMRITSTGLVGVGTTSPYANLSVHANNGGTNTTLFAIGSSTASATTTLLSVTNTGQLLVADGSNTLPAFGFVNEPGLGFYRRTTNVIQVGRPAAPTAEFVTSGSIDGIRLGSGSELGWNSTGLGGGGTDTYLGRIAAGVVGIGSNGNQGSITGTLVAENIGLGTTSPYAQLAVVATSTNGLGAPTTLFAIASTTAGTATSTLFSVSNTGNVNITNTSQTPFLNLTGPSSGISVITSGTQFRTMGLYLGTLFNDSAGISIGTNSGVNTGSVGLSQTNLVIAGSNSQPGIVWTSGTILNAYDTGISRVSANKIAIGNGVNGNFRGTLLAENIGLGTSTPYAQLAIVATSTNGVGAPTTLFAIASTTGGTATSTLFSVSNVGALRLGSGITYTNTDNQNIFTINGGSSGTITLNPNGGAQLYYSGFGTRLRSTGGYLWDNNSSVGNGTVDLGLMRIAAGTVGVSTGAAGNFTGNLVAERIGLGTSTPYAQLAIVATSTNGLGAPTTLFAIASTTGGTATSTLFSVLNNGQTGILATPGLNSADLTLNAGLSMTASGSRIFFRGGNTFIGENSNSTNLTLRGGGNTGSNTAFLSATGFAFGDNTPDFGLETGPSVGTGYIAASQLGEGDIFGIFQNGRMGLGTSTPFALMSIHATSTNGIGSPTTLFAIASSTAGTATSTLFAVTNSGNVGVGSVSPTKKLVIEFDSNANSGTAVANGLLIHDTNVGSTWDMVNANASLDFGSSDLSGVGAGGRARIGTVAETLFAVSHRLGFFTVPTAADTYVERMSILSGGNVGVGTTSPWTTFSVAGTVAAPGLVNDSTGYYVCMNTTTGQLATSTTACGASSERFKENIEDIAYGLDAVMALKPVSFDYKEQYLKNAPHQLGFIAEEVDLVIPELVARNAEGTIQGLDYPKFTSVIVKAIQDVVNIQGTFRDALVAWFASSTNEIGDFVANRVRTTELCVKDASGETCITREVLDELLAGVGATGSQGPSEEPPAEEGGGAGEEPPAEEPPVEEPPVEEQPTEEPPAEEVPPSEEPPVEESPVEESPAEEPPAEEPPAEEVASETTI